MKKPTISLAVLGMLGLVACELPGTPDFKVEQRVSTPLLLEKTFTLIGDTDALLDTTSTSMDSLFSIGSDGLVSISQEFDLNLGGFEDAVPVVNVAPTTFRSAIGRISVDDFSASFGAQIGVLKQDPQETGTVNIEFGPLVGPVPASSLTPPVTPGLQVANSGFNYAQLENLGSDPNINFIILSFTNNTSIPLTNSNRTGLPQITLRNSEGEALGGENVSFQLSSGTGNEIPPGETGTARLNIRGSKLTAGMSYTLSLGTTGGNFTAGGKIGLKAVTTELRFVEASTNIDPQGGINLNSRAKLEGDFVNAVIEDGYLTLTITNSTAIPLTLNTLKVINTNDFVSKQTGIRYKAGSTVVEQVNILVAAQSQRVLNFELDGKAISNDLTVEVDAATGGSSTGVVVKSTDAFRYGIVGGLSVSSATAKLASQTFRSKQTFNFNNPDFNFRSTNEYVQLKAGSIEIRNLVNGIDLSLDTLQISFPTILIPKTPGVYTPGDSLVIRFAGANKITRKRDAVPITLVQSLAGARLTAINNELTYNIFGKSENTKVLPAPDSIRTVRNTDAVEATVEVKGLDIDRAIGTISSKTFVLGEDVGNDGVLDLFNNNEVLLTEIDALDGLSNNIDDIIFSNPQFNMFLSHNIGVDATIYMAILGIDAKGTQVFLKGRPGSQFEVQTSDAITGLKANGTDIAKSNLLKFSLAEMANINEQKIDLTYPFNKTTTTVDEFLSNLPSKIRIVGKAILNPDNGVGFIKTPLTFNSKMGIEIPINFATSSSSPVSVEDTIKVDLSSLPGEDSDSKLEEGSLFIKYKNGLPLAIQLELDFLDAGNVQITRAPDPTLGQNAMTLLGGTINPVTRFVATPGEGTLIIGLTEAQLRIIHNTKSIRVFAAISTIANEEIKLRAQDFVSLSISANFKIGTSVNY